MPSTNVRQVRDTFLHFLADNLTGIPVHPVRFDPNSPASSRMQDAALNVSFINTQFDRHVGCLRVSLDIVHSAELMAADWTQQVFNLLSTAFMTPLMDYTNPTSPVQRNANLYWEPNGVRFRSIATDDFYNHQSCLLDLYFTPLL